MLLLTVRGRTACFMETSYYGTDWCKLVARGSIGEPVGGEMAALFWGRLNNRESCIIGRINFCRWVCERRCYSLVLQ